MRKSKKKKVVSNIIFNVIALISIVIAIIFCFSIYKLDMIPDKYLKLIFTGLGIFYLILLFFTLPRKMKMGFKVFSCIFFVLLDLVFGYGIKYADKTISFIDKINDELKQKEEYYVSVLNSGNYHSLEDLKNKRIGVYTNISAVNSKKAIETLKKNFNGEIMEYDDVINMFEDLSEKKVDALLLNDSQKSVLESELSYLNLNLIDIHSVMVQIERVEEVVKIVDVTNTPFNIYIAGGDAYGTINKVMNTDVNMVASVDPVNHKILLTSIPRDYYVNLPSKGNDAYDKLTHAGYYGIQESILAVEKLLDIDINYYAKVNFSTIEGIIDSIGGITIYNEKAFTTNDKNFSYRSGNIHLSGREALWYARERHAFNDGDVQRVKNQQKVLEAIVKKITASKTLVSSYTDLLDSVSENFATSLDTKSINRLVKMQLNDMKNWLFEEQNLTGTGATKRVYSFPTMDLYVMIGNQETLDNVIERIKNFVKR